MEKKIGSGALCAIARQGASMVAIALGLAMAQACNVDDPPPDTGGLGGEGGEGGSGGADGVEIRGVIALNTDYASTSISLLSETGEVLSPVFISSSSEKAGLSTPLSGDVVLPSSDSLGSEFAVIDRSEGVITWANFKSGKVRAQLNVGTGFNANPHDYVEVSDSKAYVTRYSGNDASGGEDFDEGHDVLVIDPSTPEITGRIDLNDADGGKAGHAPTADQVLLAGGLVRVTLLGMKPDFSSILDTRVASIDPAKDEITHTLTLEGKTNCGQMALSPDGKQLAFACWGFRAYGADPTAELPDGGIVLVNVDDELEIEEMLDAQHFDNSPVNGVTYVDASHLLVTTYGASAIDDYPAVDDQAFVFDLETKKSEKIYATTAWELGATGAPCIDGRCFLADAGKNGGVVHVFEQDGDALSLEDSVTADTETGLPPRLIRRF